MKPADYILIEPISEIDHGMRWEGVRARLKERKQRRNRGFYALVGGGVLAVAAALTILVGSRPTEVGTGAIVEARSEAVTVRLSDGSEASVEPLSQLNVLTATATELRVALPSGSATFEVTHRPERQFAVVAGDIEVQVRGTHFTVRVEPAHGQAERSGHVEVSVERGVVDVVDRLSGERIARLTAGARWSGNALQAKPVAASVRPAEAGVPIEEVRRVGPNHVPSDARSESHSDAKMLFEKATAIRRQGDTRRAMQLYGELLSRYPKDEYSRVAALELGRLRLREGDQPHAAARALEQAVKTDPQSPLQPDALAQLVAAYEQSGDLVQCRRVRARYLSEFPNGAHAAEVRRRCP